MENPVIKSFKVVWLSKGCEFGILDPFSGLLIFGTAFLVWTLGSITKLRFSETGIPS